MLLIYFSYCVKKELADSNHGVYGVLHKEEKAQEEQGWESRACPTSVAVAGAAGSLMNQPFFHKNAVRVQASIKVLLSSMVVMGVLLCSPVHTTQRKRLALLRPLLPHFAETGLQAQRLVGLCAQGEVPHTLLPQKVHKTSQPHQNWKLTECSAKLKGPKNASKTILLFASSEFFTLLIELPILYIFTSNPF